ncbi:MAG: hypothetical protein LR001_09460 [Clostridiales bacterium]|nr:hypothetical protein [Clostridiales bacterium]
MYKKDNEVFIIYTLLNILVDFRFAHNEEEIFILLEREWNDENLSEFVHKKIEYTIYKY